MGERPGNLDLSRMPPNQSDGKRRRDHVERGEWEMTKLETITRGDFQKLIPDTQKTRTAHELYVEEEYEIDDSWIVSMIEVGIDGVLNIYCLMPEKIRRKYKI